MLIFFITFKEKVLYLNILNIFEKLFNVKSYINSYRYSVLQILHSQLNLLK